MRAVCVVLVVLAALAGAGLTSGCCGSPCDPPQPCSFNPCRWWEPCGCTGCAPLGDPCDCCDPRG